MARPAPFPLHKYIPNNVALHLIPDPVRLRRLRGGRQTGWVRPGVFCDGNPCMLSQPLPRGLARTALVAKSLWAIEEIDEHALPRDPELREPFVGWLKERYDIPLPDEVAAAPAAEDSAEADAETNEGGAAGEQAMSSAPPVAGMSRKARRAASGVAGDRV